ncbi:SSL1 RNA polymerase II transcription initiation nucleotide excision repair factor TFIIH subunit SSL1 [Pyrenophora tritici-repentis]|uniref:General transcription and DNA repair factor IIH n=1 Tax=Pyrenophora tritici-repentis TaxID=45151 RepID=A0A2W1E8C9_9PLEO|nr:TFIIH basal transcription factor complex p44 protein [Pyrenophora tritici-repentis]KAG9384596.1 TFIIH basal transcription factor complex p44 protein [Pyrenophora tritici-repentis]KAI1516911.1 TFIIH basal transcription factor complex p44 protein [Pyrenophora tritici-repentis]KAI1543590.1 SSL1 RNA polymerase II transcription initiation nucleotide excision repair factor TFIIH subunit SSL1 [Pyrenophora tritici-repentis]KAI1548565.1 SSL1 RNA polymerase II transcription initiation nucleotide excis
MADSDYDFEDEGSDDEYVGNKSGTSSTRAQSTTASKRRKVEVPVKEAPRRQAWETEDSRTVAKTIQTAEDDTLGQSVQEREEERKRKRLRKDTKPFQRGIIRHVVLVLDLSEAMLEKDMRPNRFITMINFTQEYVREFFEQNPISQMSVLGMHDGVCIRVSELSGNPAEHVAAIQGIRSKDDGKEPKGAPSLQNALELARATLYHTPSHGTREVIVVFGSLLSLDPGDIHQTVKACVRDRIRVSVIGMSARLKICTEIVTRTNAGDESEYTIATDQEMLKELLLATTTPPVIRQSAPVATTTAAPSPESAAALMMMGFPSRVVEDQLTMCACHGNLTMGGYTCSRCSAKVCSLPITCPSCQLTLLLSTHLARSYHHLFPLRNWATVSWSRAREKGSKECVGCLSSFSKPPTSDKERSTAEQNGEVNGTKRDEEDSEEQKASESGRYECRACESHFCIDCDMFAHMVLHNCPGCLGRLDPGAGSGGLASGGQNGDVVMSG